MERIKFPLTKIVLANDANPKGDFIDETVSIEKGEWKHEYFYYNSSRRFRAQLFDNFEAKLRDTDERVFAWLGIEGAFQIYYYFRRIDGKWYLIKIRDLLMMIPSTVFSHRRAPISEEWREDPMQPIETERLTLRNFTAEDGPVLQKMIVQYQASPYAKYDHQWPTDPEKIKGVAKWFAEGDAYLAVCLKETGVFIGFVCLNPMKREELGGLKQYSIGYIFDFDFHRKGYATEACNAVLAYAFESLGADTVITGTAEKNLPSCNLLGKIGMSVVSSETASFQTDETGKAISFLGLSYAVTKEHWEKMKSKKM